MDNNKILISLSGINKIYKAGMQGTRALSDINLDIYENELVVVYGKSGSGKTTLLNIIGGMDTPSEGSYLFEDSKMQKQSVDKLTAFRKDTVGFVFQAYNLMPNLTARENLSLISEICTNPMDVDEALEKVELTDRADHFPSQLSGGQQQRVSIARAIVKRPKLILADEPTAALDGQTSIEVLDMLEKIVRDSGCTLIMITHNMEIAKIADRIIKLKDGKIESISVNENPIHALDIQW